MPRQPSDPAPGTPETPGSQEPEQYTPLAEEQAAALEAELRSLPMRAPSDMLDARIAASLASPAAHAPPALSAPAQRRWKVGLSLAAAVAIAALAGLAIYLQPTTSHGPSLAENPGSGGQADPQNPGNPPRVVQASHNFDAQPINLRWTRDVDAGTLQSKDHGPARAIRRQEVLQRVWVDPDRGVTIQYIEPSEELLVSKQDTF